MTRRLNTAFTRIVARGRLWRALAGTTLILLGATTLLTLLGLNAGGLVARWAASYNARWAQAPFRCACS